jgi:hypothetical protein
MNEVITKLDEIEEKASAILSDAASRKEQLMARLELDKHAVDEQYERLEKETTEQLKNHRREEARQQIDQLKAENEQALQQLEHLYEGQKEELADNIFRRIIGAE